MPITEHQPIAFGRSRIATIIFSIAGVLVSCYALYLHYAPATSFCNINSWFSCDVVNKGEYSVLFGIPVAIYGILGYAAVGVFTVMGLPRITLLASMLGLFFALFLTYLEAFVIQSFCLVCLASQFVILCMTLSAWVSVRSLKSNSPMS